MYEYASVRPTMASPTRRKTDQRRPRLSRQKVLAGAVVLADQTGVGSLTMRSLADHLGVRPMALYHHVANKNEILDGIVDLVFSEIDLPSADGAWRTEMVRRAHSARRALRRHPWAIGLMESRTSPGPETLRHHDATLGVLRRAGFSVEATAHAYALLDSFVYGFAIQEASLPFDQDTVAEVARPMMQAFPENAYPHLTELATELVLRPDYSFGDEFEFGLEVILDALGRSIPGSPGL